MNNPWWVSGGIMQPNQPSPQGGMQRNAPWGMYGGVAPPPQQQQPQQHAGGGLAQMGRVNRDSGQALSDIMQQPMGSGWNTSSKPAGQMGMFGPPQGQAGLIQQPSSQRMQQNPAASGFQMQTMPRPRFGGGL